MIDYSLINGKHPGTYHSGYMQSHFFIFSTKKKQQDLLSKNKVNRGMKALSSTERLKCFRFVPPFTDSTCIALNASLVHTQIILLSIMYCITFSAFLLVVKLIFLPGSVSRCHHKWLQSSRVLSLQRAKVNDVPNQSHF